MLVFDFFAALQSFSPIHIGYIKDSYVIIFVFKFLNWLGKSNFSMWKREFIRSLLVFI